MDREERRFLDLDMVAEQILDSNDRKMFKEAVRCYQIASHRAAAILVWCATADCLSRRLEELAADGDSDAKTAIAELKPLRDSPSFEENLIGQSRKCDIIDDFEKKCLTFARDLRTRSAHPTGVEPSAEAVRHVFHICTQSVLCRPGYRATAYIRDVVSTQFSDRHFLPEQRETGHCASIIDRVPNRLWFLFTKFAAELFPKAPADGWRSNATAFFQTLLAKATDEDVARKIALGMEGFEAGNRDFFVTLVGLDPRVTTFWRQEKRAQARSRLRELAGARITRDVVEPWAAICAADGFEEADLVLLRLRVGYMARHFPDAFLQARRKELYGLFAEMTSDDAAAPAVAPALSRLFASSLGEVTNEDSRIVIQKVIQRFKHERLFGAVVASVSSWKNAAVAQFLEMAEEYLAECDEDAPDDILVLFAAATDLVRHDPLLLPPVFIEALCKVLRAEFLPSWSDEGSEIGGWFVRQVATLLDRVGDCIPEATHQLRPALDRVRPKPSGDETA